MKTACIYHSIDLDGWMSAAIVKHWYHSSPDAIDNYDDKLDFIGYNYGDLIPDLSEYDSVVMVDISFPKENMEVLFAFLQDNFIWCDHHISAIKDSETMFYYKAKGLRDTKFAACELTWKYFFPNDPMPEIVRLLGRYDCFGHKGTEEEQKVLEFQYGARSVMGGHEAAYSWLTSCVEGNGKEEVDKIWEMGRSIYFYLCLEAKQSYKNGFVWIHYYPKEEDGSLISPKRFIMFNKERFNPINFGIDYHKDGYDGAACFHCRADGKWAFSLYNDNGQVDCSIIAKQYGGGGHAGASGFVVQNLNDVMK